MEYFFPIFISVTNSALPEWEATDNDGYALGLKGDFKYFYTSSLSLCVEFMGGKIHWEGSGWKPYPGGSAKWPENNTLYVGSILKIVWTF